MIRPLAHALLFVIALVPGAASRADQPDPAAQAGSATSQPWRFRRVLVPSSQIQRLARGYMPMDRDEFQMRLQRVNNRARSADGSPTRIDAAWYYTVHRGGSLVDGVAHLDCVHAGSEMTPLVLSPCRLASGPLQWTGGPEPVPALAGQNVLGQFVVLADRTGGLRFTWSLRGQAQGSGETAYEFAGAPALRTRLVLDVPTGLSVRLARGILEPWTADMGPTLPAGIPSLPAGHARWVADLGGEPTTRLVIAPPQAARLPARQMQTRQQTTYLLTDDGLELRSRWRLAEPQPPIGDLLLAVDPELILTDVQLSGSSVPWSQLAAEDGVPARRVRIALPAPTGDGPRELVVSALATLRTDQPWCLPRVLLPDCFWLNGTVTVTVAPSLTLGKLAVSHAEPVDVQDVASDELPQAYRFRLFGPAATAEVLLRHRKPVVTSQLGTTVRVGRSAVTAQSVIDLQAEYGQPFVVVADLAVGWTLDGIDADPGTAIEDYGIESLPDGLRRLRILLAEPLVAGRPIRLFVRAHRAHDLVVTAQHFRPLQLRDIQATRRLVALAADAAYRLNLTGDAELEVLDRADLTPSDRQRLAPNAGHLLFEDDGRADPLEIRLAREDPMFSATIQVTASVRQGVLTETYRIERSPESAPLDRLVVRLSETRAAPVDWQLTDRADGVLRADRLADPRRSGVTAGDVEGETWEVFLRQATSQPFTLEGRRETRLVEPVLISLATLPAAAAQEGWLTIISNDGRPLSIDARGVRAIPVDPTPAGAYPMMRARYRYDPSHNAQVTLAPAAERETAPLAWAWAGRLESRFDADGNVVHRATFRLENAGRAALTATLPEAAVPIGIEVDGLPVSLPTQMPPNGQFSVALPGGKRFTRVDLLYRQRDDPIRGLGGLSGVLPRLDIPILDQRWTVWLPPDYSAQPQRAMFSATASGAEPSWGQRLLGPLAARPGQQPFDLFALRDWRRLLVWDMGSSLGEASAAPRVLRRLGESLLDLRADPVVPAVPTWRDLMRQYDRHAQAGPGGASETLLIDTQMLADDGFSVEQPLPELVAGTPLDSGAAVLARSGLILLDAGPVLLLTTTNGLSRWGDAAEPAPWRSVRRVRAGTALARHLETAASRVDGGYLPIQAWVARPAAPDDPWRVGLLPRGSSPNPVPTQVLDMALGGDGTAELEVYRVSWLVVWSWAAFWAAAGLSGLCWQYRRALALPWLIALATVALLVPPLLIPVSARAVWGGLLGLAVMAFRRDAAPRVAVPETGSTRSRLVWGAGIVGIVAIVVWAALANAPAHAQNEESVASPSPVYQVLIPVDDQQQPVGRYDYLPLGLYDAIHQRSKEGNNVSSRWLIRSAQYAATFGWSRQRAELELTGLTAMLRVDVFEPAQTVQLPWQQDSPDAEILEARLDGQPVELVWTADRTAFSCQVPVTGLAQLELVLRPRVEQDRRIRNIRLPIPPVPNAVLRVEAPAEASPCDVPTGLGPPSPTSDGGVWEYTLGPTPLLTLCWSADAANGGSPHVESEQLLWLHCAPAGTPAPVVLDACYTLRSDGERMEPTTLRGDRRLEYVPAVAAEDLVPPPEIEDLPDGRRFRFTPPPAAESPWTLHARFMIRDAEPLGQLPLPTLDVEGATCRRRWLAITVPNDWDVAPASEDKTPATLPPLEPGAFLAAWGDAPATPQMVLDVPAASPSWYLSLHTLPPRTEATQQLRVRVESQRIDWVFQAQINTEQGRVFQHAVRFPEGTELVSAVVTQDDATVSSVVVPAEPGQATVFLGRGIEGQSLLELRGRQRLAEGTTEVPVPLVTLHDATVVDHEVYVFRQPEVLVEVRPGSEPPPHATSQVGTFQESFGRLVAAWNLTSQATGPPAAPILTLRANRPQPTARMVTRVQRVQERWETELELQVRLTGEHQDVLDTLRLSVPAEWSGPYSVDPAVPYRLRGIPGQSRRHLILRPDRPITNQFSVRIRAALDLAPNERVRTPDIVPLDMVEVDRFMVLPTQLDQQRIDWETRGLQPVPLRDVLGANSTNADGLAAYRVWSRYQLWSKPQAVISDVRRVAGDRQINVADVHVSCPPTGCWYGAVTFQLEPAGASSCTLVVPQPLELIQVCVDDVPATLQPLADRRWHVQLGPDQLPQQVSVVFRALASDPSPGVTGRLAVPWITDFNVVRTLWTVASAPGQLTPVHELKRDRVTGPQQTMQRLTSLGAEIESAAEVVLDSPPDEIADWYAPWAVRLAAALARHDRQRRTGQPVDAHSLRALEQRQLMIAEGLRTTSILENALRHSADCPQIADLWAVARPLHSTVARYAFSGSAPELALSATRAHTSAWWSRLSNAVACGLLGLLAWGAGRYRVLCSWPRQWPFLCGALLGVGWWLYASPSGFGWLIIGLSVLAALRPVGQKRDEH